MDLRQAEHQAHTRYISHVMGCRGCYAPIKRYCFDGHALHADNVAHFLMGQDLHTRRVHLARMETTDPGLVDDVKGRMIDIHDQLKEDDPE